MRQFSEQVEDVAVASLRFASGALGCIEASTASFPGAMKRIDVLPRMAFSLTLLPVLWGHIELGVIRISSRKPSGYSNEPCFDTETLAR